MEKCTTNIFGFVIFDYLSQILQKQISIQLGFELFEEIFMRMPEV